MTIPKSNYGTCDIKKRNNQLFAALNEFFLNVIGI